MKVSVFLAVVLLLSGCTGSGVTDAALQNCYESVRASVTIPPDTTPETLAKMLVHIREICADEAEKNPEQFQSTYGD